MGKTTKGWISAHPVLAGLGVLLVVSAGVGAFVWNSVFGLESSVVYFGVPDAPALTAAQDETLYRIDASRSKVTYRVEEQLAGASHTATGATQGIAGDIALNAADPADSRVGDIVVNVQQLTSDQRLRDERLRHDFLESNDYQLATFAPDGLEGLPNSIEEGTEYRFTIEGDLTVKETTKPVTLEATGTLADDQLTIDAATTVSLSAFDIGPINMVGFVSAGDDAELTFELVGVDAENFDDVNRVAAASAPEDAAPANNGPSFATAVQPILENSCASCHQAGEAGAPFWELEQASDATRVADGLALITESGYMPPFLATDAGIPLNHDPRLSDDEITIGDWAAAGAQLDVADDAPIEPAADLSPHLRADVTLTADAPYQGSTSSTNDYRCLVMDPELAEPTVITGYEFVPDQTEFVHHALTYRLSADRRTSVDRADANDDGTGYECFGGIAPNTGLSPSGRGGGAELVAGWAPGQQPGIFPDGSGLHMEPGELLFVTQVHYHYVHAAPPDQSELVLQLADDSPDDYDQVKVTTYLAPAEIPCGPDEEGPLCDREAAIAQLIKDYGPSAATIANGLNLICDTTPEQTANLDAEGNSTSSCEQRVRNPGRILSVLGHMHELGTTFRMTLNPGTTDEKILLDIDRWDFNWQFNYAPVEDVLLKRGDTIKVECGWDRDLINPQAEPRWVTWSEGTEDEMCFSTIATLEPKE